MPQSDRTNHILIFVMQRISSKSNPVSYRSEQHMPHGDRTMLVCFRLCAMYVIIYNCLQRTKGKCVMQKNRDTAQSFLTTDLVSLSNRNNISCNVLYYPILHPIHQCLAKAYPLFGRQHTSLCNPAWDFRKVSVEGSNLATYHKWTNYDAIHWRKHVSSRS